MTIDLKYIENGITINGNPKDGYTVFTPATQHFKVASLTDLTIAKFESMIQKQLDYEKTASELYKASDMP